MTSTRKIGYLALAIGVVLVASALVLALNYTHLPLGVALAIPFAPVLGGAAIYAAGYCAGTEAAINALTVEEHVR